MRLKINGKTVEANSGEKILDVLKREGIEVPTLCQDEQIAPFGSCRLCLVMAGEKLVVACSTPVADGIEIETDIPSILELRKTALELLISDHYADCVAPCSLACPSKVDVQGYIGFAARGEFDSATKLIKHSLALPSTLGRVCPAFCEEAQCRRGLVDEPISIRNVKKFIADRDLFSFNPYVPPKKPSTGKTVAVIGSGPAGLSCAYFLAQWGHKVVIFEALPEPGGMLRYGIPSYRLPKDVLDREIRLIISLGIEIKTGIQIGNGLTLTALRKKYDAVFIGVGAGIGKSMRIPGEEIKGVFQGVDFLRRFTLGEPLNIGKKVVVVGGGNTAIDSARTALRMGADVRIVYRRSRKEMPGHHTEVEDAEAEGIDIDFLTNPVQVIGNGRVNEIECIRMKLGEPDASGRRRPVPIEGSEFRIKADSIITAIGQSVDLSFNRENEVATTKWNSVEVNMGFFTNLPGVYAGGDAVRGPATVVEASYDGREAARCIDAYLTGVELPKENYEFISKKGEFAEIPKEEYEEYEKNPRLEPKKKDPKRRKKDFSEIEKGFTEEETLREAQRCIECGCMARYECDLKRFSTFYEAHQETYKGESHHKRKDKNHPLIIRDEEKCILCGSCVRVCDEVRCIGAFGFAGRGFGTSIDTFFGRPLLKTECESCGNCVDICPTGALWDKNIILNKPIPLDYEKIETICPFCGYGCKINLCVWNGRLEKVKCIDEGGMCVRGRFGPVLAQNKDRLLEAYLKNGKKLDIHRAVEIVRSRLSKIKEKDGPDSLAFFVSPRSLTEEIEECAKLAESMGTRNLFTFSPDTAVIGSETYQDIDWDNFSSYDTILLLGFDSWILRSVYGVKVRQARRNGVKLIIAGYDDMLSVYRPDTFIPLKNLKSEISNLKSNLKKSNKPLIVFNPGVDRDVLALVKENLNDIPMAPVYTKSNMRTLVNTGITSPPLNKKFKGIFVFGEDPVGLCEEPSRIKDFFKDVEFSVVCDLFLTQTAKLADVVIPTASFAEIDGSFVNMMGKMQNIKRAISPLTGFTNLQLLKMLNAGTKIGKIKLRFSNSILSPPLK
ncbi:MAG: FAD-dependent oxidoreductase, partial [bacterium]|nr:FAD-dependent oxidoreductase [bacterium]